MAAAGRLYVYVQYVRTAVASKMPGFDLAAFPLAPTRKVVLTEGGELFIAARIMFVGR